MTYSEKSTAEAVLLIILLLSDELDDCHLGCIAAAGLCAGFAD